MNTKPMSEAQLNLIRSLFREISPLMSDQAKKEFIEKMNNDKATMSTKDASARIDFLKSVRSKANLAKAQAMRAKQTAKAVEIEEEYFFPLDDQA